MKPRCDSCDQRRADAIDRSHKIFPRVCGDCWEAISRRAKALMDYWRSGGKAVP